MDPCRCDLPAILFGFPRCMILLGVFFVMSHVMLAGVPIELDLGRTNQVEAKALDTGGYEITTKGGDPFVISKPIASDYDPDKQYILSFEYFCAKGLDFLELFYGPPIVAEHAATGGPVLSSEGWTSYAFSIKATQRTGSWRGGYTIFRLDFGAQPDRVIQVRNIQLREPNEHELRMERDREAILQARAEYDMKVQGLLRSCRDAVIEKAEVTDDGVRIEVSISCDGSELYLCEIPLYQSPVNRADFVWQQELKPVGGRATVELPRLRQEGDAHHDRLFSSWLVIRRHDGKVEAVSNQYFSTPPPPECELTRMAPLSKKGTVGMHGGSKFQYDDYKALGIHNCTKNIVLNALIGPEPAKDTFPHEFNGRTYYVRERPLKQLDRAMKEMDELRIVVSVIILISKNTPMTHPDCVPQGIWAMPNVSERDGWNLYAAGLDLLAQRYLRPDRKYGRITHWIMHNEVDAGWVWTNAGEKPLHTYFDLYYRSMRTADCIARRYGVAGDVLMSLTHYWTKAHNHLCYHPKDMIDLLQQRTALEGDFTWGLAYHPYPQNLRDPRTWLDTEATPDPETLLITPKNLEVLDAYMRQPRMLHNGKPRTIVLSEQGSNSRDHSEQSYRDQAAGLVWTWLKFEHLETIESYVHHRWMDPEPGGEGGLLLGFWTNLPDRNPRHSKKPVWEMYRVLGTDEQQKAVEFARQVIPPQYFEGLPRAGTSF